MSKIFYYNDFLLEKEFNSILVDIFRVVEADASWTGPNTIEWNYEKDNVSNTWATKLKKFIEKLPKEKIKEYYVKLINKIKSLPDKIRKKLIITITGIFLTLVSLNYLITPTTSASNLSTTELNKEQVEEIVELNKQPQKASFEKAQEHVKISEAGYSSDKSDIGNWIKLSNGDKIFIGTKYGISAPILQDFLGKTPTQDDMMNLSYDTALQIYKSEYWDDLSLGTITNQNVANIIYDGCVNQGSGAMRSVLRKSLEENGLDIKDSDVIFSINILNELNQLNQEKLFNSIKKHREERYRDSKTFKIHGKGWLKRLNNMIYENKISIFDSKWINFAPKQLTIVTNNGEFSLKRSNKHDNINYPVDVSNIMNFISITYFQNTAKNNDVLFDGEPDQLEIDISFVKDNTGEHANPDSLRLNIDITYGDNMQYEFTIDKPNKVKVYHYTGKNSLYDPETFWGFDDNSLQELITFFNRFGFKTTADNFKFIDSDPDSYSYENN